MKTPAPKKAGTSAGTKHTDSIIKGFEGTDNPRDLRLLQALLTRPLPRESVDKIAGCSNGPDLISRLRRLGLDLPCERIDFIDRDGFPCRPGVYSLTALDRRLVHRWLAQRGRAVQ